MTGCTNLKKGKKVMNELQIISLEKTDITSWDFVSIKAELAQALSVYKNMVYSDETIKSAKDDKAVLAKVKKLIEDQRKAYKAKCLAPYEAIEPQLKELVSMIEDQRLQIDEVVKNYTERQKQEKLVSIREYYDKKAVVLGVYADCLFEKLLDTKWLNASSSMKKNEGEIQTAIDRAADEMETIKKLNSPFEETLLNVYCETSSIESVRLKDEELRLAFEKSDLANQIPIETQQLEKKAEDGENVIVNSEDGYLLKLYGTGYQLNLVTDFMKAIGVKYEVGDNV